MKVKWYQKGFIYQIYPKSFMDSNNDGIGDLQGIISKIDYIKDLGIDMVWLSPIYPSPMADNGYDIANYCDIDPSFGSMADFEEMINKFNQVNIKVIMDLVINHTSDEHHWFKEACKSKDNPYHDYYIFRDQPNNWTSFFGPTAWKYVPSCNQYYLHLFSEKQPDLNWNNPKVREEIKSILRFWLDKGVGGFRCDVINLISKNPLLPDGINDIFLIGKEHYINGPKLHDYLQELKNDVFSKYDTFTIGECGVIDPKTALQFISNGILELNMVFQFDHMAVDGENMKWMIKPLDHVLLKKALSKWQYALQNDGWNTLYFENHDQPRSVSRYGDLKYRTKSAMMLAIWLFLQKGTGFIYQGEEIGVTNTIFNDINEFKDIESFDIYETGINKYHFTNEEMMEKLNYISRDQARVPMPWNQERFGGFSTINPWLKVNDNYQTINVENDLISNDSIYHFYQKLIKLKKESKVLTEGLYTDYLIDSPDIIIYKRYLKEINHIEAYYIVCNYSDKNKEIVLPFNQKNGIIVLNNYQEQNKNEEFFPYQGKVFLVKE